MMKIKVALSILATLIVSSVAILPRTALADYSMMHIQRTQHYSYNENYSYTYDSNKLYSTSDLNNHAIRSRNSFSIFMTGDQEVPSGDHEGFGYAKVRVRENQVCIKVRVFTDATPTASHIHYAPPGVAGPIIVPLPTPNEKGKVHGCVSVDPSVTKAILDNPDNYYVNIHTTKYPEGAVRGQLQ